MYTLYCGFCQWFFCVMQVYLLLGMWLPFLFQPGVSKEFQRGFDKSGFYGTGSVDRAALIDDNVAALEIRIRMIEEAQKRLIFTNFDIRGCESGRDVAAALLAAASAGSRSRSSRMGERPGQHGLLAGVLCPGRTSQY